MMKLLYLRFLTAWLSGNNKYVSSGIFLSSETSQHNEDYCGLLYAEAMGYK